MGRVGLDPYAVGGAAPAGKGRATSAFRFLELSGCPCTRIERPPILGLPSCGKLSPAGVNQCRPTAANGPPWAISYDPGIALAPFIRQPSRVWMTSGKTVGDGRPQYGFEKPTDSCASREPWRIGNRRAGLAPAPDDLGRFGSKRDPVRRRGNGRFLVRADAGRGAELRAN